MQNLNGNKEQNSDVLLTIENLKMEEEEYAINLRKMRFYNESKCHFLSWKSKYCSFHLRNMLNPMIVRLYKKICFRDLLGPIVFTMSYILHIVIYLRITIPIYFYLTLP